MNLNKFWESARPNVIPFGTFHFAGIVSGVLCPSFGANSLITQLLGEESCQLWFLASLSGCLTCNLSQPYERTPVESGRCPWVSLLLGFTHSFCQCMEWMSKWPAEVPGMYVWWQILFNEHLLCVRHHNKHITHEVLSYSSLITARFFPSGGRGRLSSYPTSVLIKWKKEKLNPGVHNLKAFVFKTIHYLNHWLHLSVSISLFSKIIQTPRIYIKSSIYPQTIILTH